MQQRKLRTKQLMPVSCCCALLVKYWSELIVLPPAHCIPTVLQNIVAVITFVLGVRLSVPDVVEFVDDLFIQSRCSGTVAVCSVPECHTAQFSVLSVLSTFYSYCKIVQRCIVSVARYIQQYNTLSAVFIINLASHLPVDTIKFCTVSM